MSKLLSDIRMDFGGLQTWVSQQWTQRVVQVSVYAAVVFFLLSNYSLIQVVEKSVKSVSGLKLGNEGTLVLHSVIFGLFMYVGTRFILDPILVKAANGVVEGQVGQFKLEEEEIKTLVEDAEQVALDAIISVEEENGYRLLGLDINNLTKKQIDEFNYYCEINSAVKKNGWEHCDGARSRLAVARDLGMDINNMTKKQIDAFNNYC